MKYLLSLLIIILPFFSFSQTSKIKDIFLTKKYYCTIETTYTPNLEYLGGGINISNFVLTYQFELEPKNPAYPYDMYTIGYGINTKFIRITPYIIGYTSYNSRHSYLETINYGISLNLDLWCATFKVGYDTRKYISFGMGFGFSDRHYNSENYKWRMKAKKKKYI